jgi:hypothetical protein
MDLKTTLSKIEEQIKMDKPFLLIRMASTTGGQYFYIFEGKIIDNYIGDELLHKPNLEFVDLWGWQQQCNEESYSQETPEGEP